jgi:hypothetical protein
VQLTLAEQADALAADFRKDDLERSEGVEDAAALIRTKADEAAYTYEHPKGSNRTEVTQQVGEQHTEPFGDLTKSDFIRPRKSPSTQPSGRR